MTFWHDKVLTVPALLKLSASRLLQRLPRLVQVVSTRLPLLCLTAGLQIEFSGRKSEEKNEATVFCSFDPEG